MVQWPTTVLMLKNPVFLFVPEKYCLFLHVQSHHHVELLTHSTVSELLFETQVSAVFQLKANALLFHRY